MNGLRKCLLINEIGRRCSNEISVRSMASVSIDNLKGVLADKITEHQKRLNEFRVNHGNKVIDKVTIDQLFGGMRGVKLIVTETSHLDPDNGIFFRNHSLEECCTRLPKAFRGDEPLPEGIFHLLLTGEFPNDEQVKAISNFWSTHADLPEHVVSMINNFPSKLHPMSQFCAAIIACNTESLFVKAYSKGVSKASYWEYVFEDSMRLIAKLPTIAAMIYRNLYDNGSSISHIDRSEDWSQNFATMLGFNNGKFVELLRLYLTIHSDHEGGNVAANAVHLVGSTLADPYLSLASGINGLAGPLHGRANQEVLYFLNKVIEELGPMNTIEEKLKVFVRNHLRSGHVIPGYGHAVLRKTDPRYTALYEFASKNLPDSPFFKLASKLHKIVPPVLLETGKVKNPWPNVDALSGVVLQHYGIEINYNYFTVLVGVSRSLGVLSSLIWDRALNKKIVNPDSISVNKLLEMKFLD